jgi:hypothetical protein
MGSESLTERTPPALGLLHTWHYDSPCRPNGKSPTTPTQASETDLGVSDDLEEGGAKNGSFPAIGELPSQHKLAQFRPRIFPIAG